MELATINNYQIQISSLDYSLFDRFITFIDRPGQTTRTYIINLRQFAAWLAYSSIDAPQRQDIINYRQFLLSEHEAIVFDAAEARRWRYRTDKAGNRITVNCKPNTVKQYLQSVCQFFKWTAAEGLYPNIAENIHAPKVATDTHKKEALAASDVLAIEQSIKASTQAKAEAQADKKKDTQGRIDRATEQGARLYAMYMLAVNCGLRTIEISRANVKDLEYKNGAACLYIQGKGHAEADTKKTLAPGVYQAIRDYLDTRTDGYNNNSPLFVSTGNRSRGQRIAATTISRMLKQAMQTAGYDSERLTAHSLRHTAGTAAMQLTHNIYETQKYMRHSNPATTEIYLHIDTEKQEASIANRLFDYYHGQENTDKAQELEQLIDRMTAAQLEQLTNIAKAMAI